MILKGTEYPAKLPLASSSKRDMQRATVVPRRLGRAARLPSVVQKLQSDRSQGRAKKRARPSSKEKKVSESGETRKEVPCRPVHKEKSSVHRDYALSIALRRLNESS